jgi:hypothetical protein
VVLSHGDDGFMKWQFCYIFIMLFAPLAHAGFGDFGEISAMGSYSKTSYSSYSYSTTRRYTATIGINLTSVTEIEASYTFTDTFLNQDPVQTSKTNEQILGLSIIQSLLPRSWIIQPYVKAGAAQYNRRQTGTLRGIPSTPSYSKSPSALLGGGLRIFFSRNFSLRSELITYLPDFHMSQAKDNFSIQVGFSFHF